MREALEGLALLAHDDVPSVAKKALGAALVVVSGVARALADSYGAALLRLFPEQLFHAFTTFAGIKARAEALARGEAGAPDGLRITAVKFLEGCAVRLADPQVLRRLGEAQAQAQAGTTADGGEEKDKKVLGPGTLKGLAEDVAKTLLALLHPASAFGLPGSVAVTAAAALAALGRSDAMNESDLEVRSFPVPVCAPRGEMPTAAAGSRAPCGGHAV